MSPLASRATRKNASAFLLNARGCCSVETLLSPPQRGRRKQRDFYGKKEIFLVGARIARLFQRVTNLHTFFWGQGPHKENGSVRKEQKR